MESKLSSSRVVRSAKRLVLVAGAATLLLGFTSGPNVTGGANPRRTLVHQFVVGFDPAAGNKSVSLAHDAFVVPQGQRLVVTDFRVWGQMMPKDGAIKGSTARCDVKAQCLSSNGKALWCSTLGADRGRPGIVFDAGTKVGFRLLVVPYDSGNQPVDCYTSVVATGHLVKQ